MHENKVKDSQRGEIICLDCGLVLEQVLEDAAYVINPNQEGESNRSPQHVALGDRLNIVDGMGSYMGFEHEYTLHDANNKPLKPKDQKKYNRIKYRVNKRLRIAENETLYRTLSILNRVCAGLEVGYNIQYRSAYLLRYIMARSCREEYGSSPRLAAFCLYLACKEYHYPLNIKTIGTAFKNNRTRVSTRLILQTARQIKPEFANLFSKHRTTTSEEYIPQLVSKCVYLKSVADRLKEQKLNLEQYRNRLTTECMRILSLIPPTERGARNPFIFAGGIVYASCRQVWKRGRSPISQGAIADATGIAEFSLRDHWKFIENYV